jgi:hypothetical protein
VLFALAYVLLRRLVQLVAGSSNQLNCDMEVVVLRHKLMVSSARWTAHVFAVAIGCSWPR